MDFEKYIFEIHKSALNSVDVSGCSNVAKLSWKKYIFLSKKYVWFSKNLFFLKKSYLFKINTCIPFQRI